MKVTIVGTGYVGLVTGTCFAEMGNDVWCIDIDQKKIENLKNGIIPIYEPGLDEMVKSNVSEGRLNFSTRLADGLAKSDVVFIAVGTPPGEDGSADLQYVLKVAENIGQIIDSYTVVVDKSTVPVGTAEKVTTTITKELKKRGFDATIFDVVSNPEFLKEGDAIDDFMKPDRVVVGVNNEKAQAIMSDLYEPFTRNGHPVIFMDIVSAEMTKYAANSMLATRISFMNELAQICELAGADISQVRKGIGSDSRIGMPFLYAGLGYGGSCFPKDVKALVKTAQELGTRARILEMVEEVNQFQRLRFIEKLLGYYNADVKGKTFAIWGLSFKPNTDDMREAPSIDIIKTLIENGAKVMAYDPVAIDEAKHIIGNENIEYLDDNYKVLDGADALLLLTEWHQFRRPDFSRIKSLLEKPVIFDGRNQYEPARMKEQGFEYFSIGRM